ncbi:MAG: hypothetical protein V2I51_18180 [Anderseniella sp.]|jgi:hypothetical protein|nr:hypothetical protein [Anderseniella sp.]
MAAVFSSSIGKVGLLGVSEELQAMPLPDKVKANYQGFTLRKRTRTVAIGTNIPQKSRYGMKLKTSSPESWRIAIWQK